MQEYIDLLMQISRITGLAPPDDTRYEAVLELRLRDPRALGDTPAERRVVLLNRQELIGVQHDSAAYGAALTRMLFLDPVLVERFRQARERAAGASPRLLRLRLEIDPSAHELHNLRWETLCDPLTLTDAAPAWLLRNEQVPFSRFLAADSWSEVQLRPHNRLRALIVIANPADLQAGAGGMHPIDVPAELARAKAGLGAAIRPVELCSDPAQPRRVTLQALASALGAGCDMLYLVCHGDRRAPDIFSEERPCVLLEQEDGTSHWLPAAELAAQLAALPPARRPLLAVLASCQSAGTGDEARSRDDGGLLASLGPLLVREGGVPAVVAMQGSVAMRSVEQFMPAFFRKLAEPSPIDVALAAARNTISLAADRYMPALFMRLREGMLHYWRGLDGDNDLTRISSLKTSLAEHACTPIVGPGAAQHLFGSPRQIAHDLANTITPRAEIVNADELPQVALYLARRLGARDLRKHLSDRLLRNLLLGVHPAIGDHLEDTAAAWRQIEDEQGEPLARARALIELCGRRRPADPPIDLPVALEDYDDWARMPSRWRFVLIERVSQAIGRRLRPDEPLRILAGQRQPLYITATPDTLLEAALRAEGVEPVSELFRWRQIEASDDEPGWPPSIYDSERRYTPTRKRPLVYHLFGRYDVPGSLVISEDDYFEYLMAVGSAEATSTTSTPNPEPAEATAPSTATGNLPTRVREALVRSALLFLGFQVDDWAFRAVFRSLLNDTRRGQRAVSQSLGNLQGHSVAVQIAPEDRSLSPGETRRYFQDYFRNTTIDIYWGLINDFVDELG